VSDIENKNSIIPVEGWYPDPDGGHRQRFWTGAAWSEETRVSRGRKRKTGPNRFLGFLRGFVLVAFIAAFVFASILFGIHMMEQGKKDEAAHKKSSKASSFVIQYHSGFGAL
jgi:hypothetical protein